MIVPEYVPGAWHAVVAGGVVALLDPSTPTDVVRAVWDAVPARGGLADQLEVLLRDGIAGLRPFALVDLTGGRVHAALRGGVEIEVTSPAGVRVLSVGEVTTWSERSADDADEVTVRVVGALPVDASLPVVSGVVRASAVRVVLAAGRRSASTTETEPAATATSELPEPRVEAAEPAGPVPGGIPVAVPANERFAPLTLVPPAPEDDDELGDDPRDVPDVSIIDGMSTSAVVAEAEAVLAADALLALDEGALPDDVVVPDDHDGLTILSSDLQTIRDQLPSWAGDAVPGPFRVAAAELAPPAKLVLSTGQVVVLDQTVLLGRAPQVSRVSNRELPRLVTLPSPQQDISRTHAEVRADGDDVLVTDLRSTNGVLVSRPGEPARRLHPGEPSVVARGEVVDLGDGVTFTVEWSA